MDDVNISVVGHGATAGDLSGAELRERFDGRVEEMSAAVERIANSNRRSSFSYRKDA